MHRPFYHVSTTVQHEDRPRRPEGILKNYWKLYKGHRTFNHPRHYCPPVPWNNGTRPTSHHITHIADPNIIPPRLGSRKPFAHSCATPLSKPFELPPL